MHAAHLAASHGAVNAGFARARLLLVGSDAKRLAADRAAIEDAGLPEPETAITGDEALDILGAHAQQFDLVIIRPQLADDPDVDFAGILRRCKSPVRLMAVTPAQPPRFPQPGRLAGVAAIADCGTDDGFVRTLRSVLAASSTVAGIVTTKQVPPILDATWAHAIYGAPPGSHVYADLD